MKSSEFVYPCVTCLTGTPGNKANNGDTAIQLRCVHSTITACLVYTYNQTKKYEMLALVMHTITGKDQAFLKTV